MDGQYENYQLMNRAAVSATLTYMETMPLFYIVQLKRIGLKGSKINVARGFWDDVHKFVFQI